MCGGGGGGGRDVCDIDNRLDLVGESYSADFFNTDATKLHQFSTSSDFHSPIVDVE